MPVRSHGGRAPRGALDFSAPTNPLGPPRELEEALREAIESGAHARYPDYEYRELRRAIAEFYGVDEEGVVVLNGASEALQLLVPVLKPRACLFIEPTFGDHRLQLGVLGVRVVSLPYAEAGDRFVLDPEAFCGLPKELRTGSVLFLSNPNNPTGALAEAKTLERLLECAGEGSYLVVDEAFMDFTGGSESLLGRGYDDVVVVRSLTKILGVPGLRVGFAYASRRLAEALDSFRQPWNVNSVVAEALPRVLSKATLRDYVRRTIEVVEIEREFVAGELGKLGLTVYRSSAPFVLVKAWVPHPELQSRLLERGVYVRDASSFEYLTRYHSRVSVRLRAENLRLVEAFRYAVGGAQGA